eukprot:CAMPEP_0115849248 /NCGR_PEP_ID=MMETSP0287-20121206/11351_1 /TAXON_ID=412157 /ORGANISM="Chrysochromulina rotalis, Strain UIO044" /LENGTH=94 /DNA_ID=CAMNT_0003303209 /DNA_START=351 /DNA_END=635 /DNA_ORIENTATION=+
MAEVSVAILFGSDLVDLLLLRVEGLRDLHAADHLGKWRETLLIKLRIGIIIVDEDLAATCIRAGRCERHRAPRIAHFDRVVLDLILSPPAPLVW